MINDRVVFRFREGPVDIVILKKQQKAVSIKNVFTLEQTPSDFNNSPSYNSEENIKQVKEYVLKKKIPVKKVTALLSCEGIITRLVETPFLRKKELDKFVQNNISEYFTVNINDYCYDYKVVEQVKAPDKKLVIFLVVFPKKKIKEIKTFISECGLELDEITIYPESISNVFKEKSKSSVAVFDISSDRHNITILDKGKVFLHSGVTTEAYEFREESYEEILDSMEYFLNFYSTRHFGNKIDNIYLVGEYWNDSMFFNFVKEQFNIETSYGVKSIGLTVYEKHGIDKNRFCDVIGTQIKVKNIYNKKIDFKDLHEEKKAGININPDKILWQVGIIAVLFTVIFILSNMTYLKFKTNNYNIVEVDAQLNTLAPVEKEVVTANNDKIVLQKKQAFKKSIAGENLRVIDYLDILRKGLPVDVSISSISINKDSIALRLSINGTLDKLRVITAINNIGIFERLEIDSIKLDNSEREANLNLKIIKPL